MRPKVVLPVIGGALLLLVAVWSLAPKAPTNEPQPSTQTEIVAPTVVAAEVQTVTTNSTEYADVRYQPTFAFGKKDQKNQ